MISAVAGRIGKYITYLQISRREFASRLGYTSGEKINRLFRKEGAKPGFDIIADIANKFVDLDVDWLVTGRGEMLKEPPGRETEIEELRRRIGALEEAVRKWNSTQ
jgi:transcriptional regulator with XRE-family HTH domain